MPSYQVDLTSLPKDESAIPGYKVILAAWQKMYDALDAGKTPSEVDLNEAMQTARNAMTVRELGFMKDLEAELAAEHVSLRHAKLTGGLYKILMDRHGFKVTRKNGGLG
ncbi:hypothetical protein DL1_11360 [Thioclava dalianensis]|uniref:Uncharacterized protein n=1 Tax=Thioclava dalianensis TaxID=1185766 RepID=A0A074THM8_9RHOB|nr:hypothetical protein [Thioclava dalianensis]KEP68543.1 hypothetical protein DL1_11360 [Thioclava dalianensis]SFN84342.1 hypothetical protein SAMN05216224_11725 [Thioclava dalianensis]